MANDPKIQVLIEAVNNTQTQFNALKTQLSDLQTRVKTVSDTSKTAFNGIGESVGGLKGKFADLKEKFSQVKGTLEGVASGSTSAKEGFSALTGMLGGMGSKMALAGAAIVGLGVGIAAVKSSMDQAVGAATQYGAEVIKLQRMTGMQAEQASEMLGVMNLMGIQFEQIQPAIISVARKLGGLKDTMSDVDEEGKQLQDTFSRLKIDVVDKDGNLKKFADLWEEIRKKVRSEKNPFQQLADITQITKGTGGVDLLKYFRMSDEALEKAKQKVREYGLVMSTESVVAVREMIAAEREHALALKGKAVVFGTTLLPIYTTFIKLLTSVVSWLNKATKALKEFFIGPSDIAGLKKQFEKYSKLESDFLAKGTRGQSAAEHYNRLANETLEQMRAIVDEEKAIDEEMRGAPKKPPKVKKDPGEKKEDAFDKVKIGLSGELEALQVGFSEYEKAYIQFRTKIVQLKEQYSSVPGANKFLDSMLGKYDEALQEKYRQEAQQKARERESKEVVAEAEVQQRMLDLKIDFDTKYNQQKLQMGQMTNEEFTQIAIDNEVKKLEAAQNTIAVKQGEANTEAEINQLSGEYLRLQDQIIGVQKLGIEQVSEARKKDANILVEQSLTYQQNLLEVAKINGTLEEEVVIQQKILDLQIEQFLASDKIKTMTKEQIDAVKQLAQARKDELGKNLLTGGDAMGQGITDAMKAVGREMGTEYENWKTLTRTTMTNIRSTISDTFVNMLKGDFNNFGQIWDRMLDNLYRSVADKWSGDIVKAFSNMWNGVANESGNWMQSMLSAIGEWVKQVIAQIMAVKAAGSGGGGWWSTIAGWFGGGGGDYSQAALAAEGLYGLHRGGYVPAYHGGGTVALKYHAGGLTRDEVPIIAKKGEYVLSKSDVDFVNKIKGNNGPSVNINFAGGSTQAPSIVPLGVQVMIDNSSSVMLQASGAMRRAGDANYIIDVVLKDINNRGRLSRLAR